MGGGTGTGRDINNKRYNGTTTQDGPIGCNELEQNLPQQQQHQGGERGDDNDEDDETGQDGRDGTSHIILNNTYPSMNVDGPIRCK